MAATIGFFDGVHLGHRFLIDQLKKVAAEKGLPSAVITFRIHPRAVLHADYQPKLLNTWEEKLAMDVWYVNHISLKTDISIIFQTIKSVLYRESVEVEGVEALDIYRMKQNNK